MATNNEPVNAATRQNPARSLAGPDSSAQLHSITLANPPRKHVAARTRLSVTDRFNLVSFLVLSAVATFFFRAIRLGQSWDVFVDEITYLRLSQSVATHLEVTLYGEPFYLHPPAFFFLQAGYFQLFDPSGSLVEQIYSARYLNLIFAAISAMMLFLIGRAVAGYAAGAVAMGFFTIEPFVIRMNSRNYLDTSAMMWVLIGYAVLTTADLGSDRGLSRRRLVLAGVMFGLAALTKDMTVLITLLPIGVCFWMRWVMPRIDCAIVGIVAVLTYFPYPLTIAIVGETENFLEQKTRGLLRFTGHVQETGFNQEGGPSFLRAVIMNLDVLATTYAFIALGGVAIVVLFLQRSPRARLIALLTASSYAMIGYSAAFGTSEEQFFYFLTVPSIVATTTAVAILFKSSLFPWLPRPLLRGAVIAAVCIFLFWSSLAWGRIYFTPDNGYERLVGYVEREVPAGARIAATNDESTFLLSEYVHMPPVDSVAALRDSQAEYVIISSKQVETGFGTADRELAAWIEAHGEAVFTFEGRSFGELSLYRLNEDVSQLR